MMQACRPAVLLVLLTSLILPLSAAPREPETVVLQPGRDSISLRDGFRMLVDHDGTLRPEAVAQRRAEGERDAFRRPSLGRQLAPVWGHATVENATRRALWILTYSLSTIEDIEVYQRGNNVSNFSRLSALSDGSWLPFTGQRLASYVVELPPGETVELVVRLQTRAPIGFHLWLSNPIPYFAQEKLQSGAAGLLTAIPVLVIAYVSVLWSTLRTRALGYFLGLMVSLLVVNAWLSGLGALLAPFIPRWFWPNFAYTFIGMLPLFAWLHAREFLQLAGTRRLADRLTGLQALTIVALVLVELSALANTRTLVQILFPLFSASITTLAVHAAWRGSLGMKVYAVAWLTFLSIAVIQLLRLFIVLPWAIPLTIYGQSAGASLLFSAALLRQLKEHRDALDLALRDSQERFRLMMEGSVAALYEYDARSRRFTGSDRIARLVGGEPVARIGMLLRQLPSQERRSLFRSLRSAVKSRRFGFQTEIVIRSGPEARIFAVAGAIHYGLASRLATISGSVIDVSSAHALEIQRRLAAELAHAKQRAETALAERTRFFAAVNHDLRHPILAIGLYLNLLRKAATTDRLQQYLPHLTSAQASASRFLDQAVSAATDPYTQSATNIALAEFLPDLLMRFLPVAEARGLKLRLVNRDLTIRCDPVALDHILSNLVINALENTQRGGVLIGVRVRNNTARIDVIDTGIGILAEDQARIFDVSVRLSTDAALGRGLGLAIVRQLAAANGLHLELTSRPGRGTRFSLSEQPMAFSH